MSDSHSTSTGSGLINSAILYVVLLIPTFFGLQGTTKTTTAPSDDTALGWPKHDFDLTTLATQRQTFHTTSLPETTKQHPKIKTLMTRVAVQNNHTFVTAPIPAKNTKELTALFQDGLTGAMEVLKNKQSYGQLVDMLIPKCTKALNALRKDVQIGKVTIKIATTDPDINEYATYRTSCGNLLGALKQFGLVDDKAQWKNDKKGPAIAELLQRYRWSMAGAPAIPVKVSLAPSDHKTFVRWRIESDAFDEQARLGFLRRADPKMLPYHNAFARALIHRDAKNWKRAKAMLRVYAIQKPMMAAQVSKWIAQMPATPSESKKKTTKKTSAPKKSK